MRKSELQTFALQYAADWLVSDAEGNDVEGLDVDDEEKLREEVLKIARRLSIRALKRKTRADRKKRES